MLLANTLADGMSVILILPVLQAIFGGTNSAITNDFLRESLTLFDNQVANIFPNADKEIILLLILLSVFVIKAVFSLWSYRVIIKFPWDWIKQKKVEMMQAYMESKYHFFTKQSHGSLINTIITDSRLGAACIQDFLNLISNILIALILIFVLLITNFKITLVLILFTPLLFLFTVRFVHTSSKIAGRQRLVLNKDIWNQVNQNLTGMQKIWTLGLEEKRLSRFSNALSRLSNLNSREFFKAKIPSILAPLLIVGILTVCILYFKLLTNQDPAQQISIIALFVVVSNRLFATFSVISSNYIGFIKGVSNLVSLEKALAAFNQNKRNIIGKRITEIKDSILFENVSFKYPDTDLIFKDVSFEIPYKKTTLIIGESGAGKSTLINMILGFLHPTDGKIKLNGEDLMVYDHKHLLSCFGVVSQDIFLFDQSIFTNLQYYDATADAEKMYQALQKAGLKIKKNKFPEDLDTKVGEKGVRLSGGEKQRISIASSFLQDPDVFIFDEPTSALDKDTESLVMESLKAIKGEKTTIIISHNSRFKDLADHIFLIDNGNIIAE